MAKSWALFFAAGADQAGDRFAVVACRYVSQCLELRIPPAHLPILRQVADRMMRALLDEMGLVRDNPAERQRLAACLRWVCENAPVEPPARPRPAAVTIKRSWTAAPGLAVA